MKVKELKARLAEDNVEDDMEVMVWNYIDSGPGAESVMEAGEEFGNFVIR